MFAVIAQIAVDRSQRVIDRVDYGGGGSGTEACRCGGRPVGR